MWEPGDLVPVDDPAPEMKGATFTEALHPREHGKFAHKPGSGIAHAIDAVTDTAATTGGPRPKGEMATRPPVGSWVPHTDRLFEMTVAKIGPSKADHEAFQTRLESLPLTPPAMAPFIGVEDYKDRNYRDINGFLEGSLGDHTANPTTLGHQVAAIDRAFTEAGLTTDTYIVLKRGILGASERWQGGRSPYVEGTVIQEAGYVSTALEDTRSFAGVNGWTMNIMVPPGHKYLYGTFFEREVILNRGTTQRVVKVDAKARRIWVEVEPPA